MNYGFCPDGSPVAEVFSLKSPVPITPRPRRRLLRAGRTALSALLLCALLACTPRESGPSPTPANTIYIDPGTGLAPTATPTTPPTATPTPTPTPTATPEPTPVVYDLESFLPTGDLHISYTDENGVVALETYVEYADEAEEAVRVQHRVITRDSDSPYVQVTQCRSGQLVRTYLKPQVGYTYNVLGSTQNEEEALLCEPVTLGTEWEVKGGTRAITAVDRIIDVSLGSYRAVEVTTRYDDGSRTVQYYVPDFGLLCEYGYAASGERTHVLEASTQESDQGFTQLIRFYFVQPYTSSIRYQSRRVTIMPNASMGSRFINQFRTAPSGSGLITLDDVSINSIRLDSHGYVHVDFSSSLITTVSSIGRTSEGLLLTALANTFCEYYQTSRMYITVNGGLYESPYRFLMDGEYLSPDLRNVSALD